MYLKYSYQLSTLILSFASFLSQSVIHSHLLLFSNVKFPLCPSSKFIEIIFVEFKRQYLLKSYIMVEFQPFNIWIYTFVESYFLFNMSLGAVFVYGFLGISFFFIFIVVKFSWLDDKFAFLELFYLLLWFTFSYSLSKIYDFDSIIYYIFLLLTRSVLSFF